MTIEKLSEIIKEGKTYFGLRVDHRKFIEPATICQTVKGMSLEQVVQLCSRLDLCLFYYHLTGKDPNKYSSKYVLASALISAAKKQNLGACK